MPQISPLLFVPQILFCGFFVKAEQIPVFLRWAQYLCGLKYSLNLMLIIEMNPDSENCRNTKGNPCQKFLDLNDVHVDDWWIYVVVLLGIASAFRLIANYILRLKSNTYGY